MAWESGVKHVVLLSTAGAEHEASALAQWYRRTEMALESLANQWKQKVKSASNGSDFSSSKYCEKRNDRNPGTMFTYTILRTNMLYQSLLLLQPQSLRETKQLVLPTTAASKISFVDARDVAAIAFAALTKVEHQNKSYAITGPAPLTPVDLTKALTQIVGSNFEFVECDLDAALARWKKEIPKLDVEYAKALGEVFELAKKQYYSAVSRDLEVILDRGAITFREYLIDNNNELCS
jgi:uncharacterized protein YbjT (DUF2867 family)